MAITLNTRIILFDMQIINPLEFGEQSASWQGTLAEFWEANQDDYGTWGEFKQFILNPLIKEEYVWLGGGAVGCTTLATERFVEAAKANKVMLTTQHIGFVIGEELSELRAFRAFDLDDEDSHTKNVSEYKINDIDQSDRNNLRVYTNAGVFEIRIVKVG